MNSFPIGFTQFPLLSEEPPSDTEEVLSEPLPNEILTIVFHSCNQETKRTLRLGDSTFNALVIREKAFRQEIRIRNLVQNMLLRFDPFLDQNEIMESRKILSENLFQDIWSLEGIKQRKYEIFQRLKFSNEKLKIDHLLAEFARQKILENQTKEAFAISKLIPNECVRYCAFKLVAQFYTRSGNIDKALLIVNRITCPTLRNQAHGLIFIELRQANHPALSYLYSDEKFRRETIWRHENSDLMW